MNTSTASASESEANVSGLNSKPSSNPSDEPLESLPWREEVLRNQFLIRQAHEGLMMDKIQKQNRIVRQLAQTQMQQLQGASKAVQAGPVENGEEAEDDVGVSIGNQYHYHLQQREKPDEPPASETEPRSSNRWLPAALTALALLGAAGGGGWAGYLMTRPTSNFQDTDTDNITEVRPGFGQPENVERQ